MAEVVEVGFLKKEKDALIRDVLLRSLWVVLFENSPPSVFLKMRFTHLYDYRYLDKNMVLYLRLDLIGNNLYRRSHSLWIFDFLTSFFFFF